MQNAGPGGRAVYGEGLRPFACRDYGFESHWYMDVCLSVTSKGKAVPLQAWTGPEVSSKLRFPDFVTTAQDGGKIVSLTHQPPLPPRKYSWYSFLLEG